MSVEIGETPRTVPRHFSPAARLSGHVRLARPYSLLWFICAPVATMAVWLRGANVPIGSLVPLMFAFTLADAGLTTLNDISDQETDRMSVESQRSTRPLVAGVVSVRAAYVQVVLLEAGALAAALAVSPALLALLGGGVLYGIAYSARPLYAGGRPIVSQVFWVVVWLGMYVVVYVTVGGKFSNGLPYVVAIVLFMGFGETLAKDLRDLDNDSLTGKRTTPVMVGAQIAGTASLLALVLGSIGLVVAAAAAPRAQPGLIASVIVVLGLWCGRAFILRGLLRERYEKADARALHMGCIRVFLTVNLLFITGLSVR